MTDIQMTIREYLKGKTEPTSFDLDCFVGMIETGEANYADFRAVGGFELEAEVAKAVRNAEDAE